MFTRPLEGNSREESRVKLCRLGSVKGLEVGRVYTELNPNHGLMVRFIVLDFSRAIMEAVDSMPLHLVSSGTFILPVRAKI